MTARSLLLSGLLLGCGPEPEDNPPSPPVCDAAHDLQASTGTTTEVDAPGCGTVTLGDFRVIGEGTYTIELFSDGERVYPRIIAESDASVFRGLLMSGTFELTGAAPLQLWQQPDAGGPNGVVAPPAATALDGDGVPLLGDAEPGISRWAGLVGRGDGASALVGVHSAVGTRFAAAFAEDGAVHAVWGNRGEVLPLDAGDELFLDPLYVSIGPDPVALWARWAAAVVSNGEITIAPAALGPGLVVNPSAGEGEEQVLAILAAAVSLTDDLALSAPRVVYLDAGWELAVGDWTAGVAFPSGTGAVAEDIAKAGFLPALWLAPFGADPDTALVADHPDWWVTDDAGLPVVVDGLQVLDVTRAEAATFVQDLVAAKVAEGWKVFVLDHLDGAMVEGARSVPITGTYAYRTALELVRGAAGASWITAASAPFLPSVGLVDGYRLGGPDELLTRTFTSGTWWWLDAGSVSLDAPDPISGALVAAALGGGSWELGGFLPTIEADRVAMALDVDLVALGVGGAVPIDPLGGTDLPVTWVFPSGDTALLDLTATALTVSGPGGVELLTGVVAEPGDRILQPRTGEIWSAGE